MKMSDVFSLPVEPNDGFDEYLVAGTKEINLLGDQAIAAAHAINNHDELTEELDIINAKYAAVCAELEQATVDLDELRSNGK